MLFDLEPHLSPDVNLPNYADDMTVCSRNNESTAAEIIQNDVNIGDQWTANWYLIISKSKT